MSEAGPRSARERAERRVGATLLKWKLDALLGIGGMAAVYAATHKNRSRVALKVLHRELAMSTDIRERFMREAYVANSVNHPGAVQVLDDYVSDDDEPFLVMELLDGQSLEAVQNDRGTLPPGEVLDIAEEILDVLAAAHDAGIVHRDIKPQNLFVTRSGSIKVLDFGIARILEGASSATATGSLLGTPAFMPPEQAGGRTSAVCAASDLWSVGATLFTLLTGRFVHEAENAQAHTVKAAVTHARSLKTLLPTAPVPLVRLVDQALAFDIADRFQDARRMQAAVRQTRLLLVPVAAAEEDSDDEYNAETRAFPTGAVRAAIQAARPRFEGTKPSNEAPPPDASMEDAAQDQDADTNEVKARRIEPENVDEDDETSVLRGIPRLAAQIDGKRRANAGEPPTLSPRPAVLPGAGGQAAPFASAASIDARPSDEMTTGALLGAAATSVVVVPHPAFPNARPSNRGGPPPPPQVAASSPPQVAASRPQVAASSAAAQQVPPVFRHVAMDGPPEPPLPPDRPSAQFAVPQFPPDRPSAQFGVPPMAQERPSAQFAVPQFPPDRPSAQFAHSAMLNRPSAAPPAPLAQALSPLSLAFVETEQAGVLPDSHGQRTLPLGVAPAPPLSHSQFGEQRGPLATAPLPIPVATEAVLPRADLHAQTEPFLSSYSNPAAVSVGAQSISQIVVPPKPARPHLGKQELLAIAGALMAIVLVSYLLIRALMSGDGAPPGAAGPGAEGPSAPVSASATTGSSPTSGTPSTVPEPQPVASGTPSTAEEPEPASSTTSTSSSATASAAPATTPKKYYPPPAPSEKRWKKKLEPNRP